MCLDRGLGFFRLFLAGSRLNEGRESQYEEERQSANGTPLSGTCR